MAIRAEHIRANDRGEFAGHAVLPASGFRPGMTVIHEIIWCERLRQRRLRAIG